MNEKPTSLITWANQFFGLSLSLISSLFLVRLIVDTGFRMFYAFLPQFTAGLKVSISTFSWFLLLRSASAFLSPAIGRLADRYGRRRVMSLALLSQTLGLVGIFLSTGWWAVFPIFLCGIAVNAYLPAQQAYISDLAPYKRRGRALASVDIAFAVSGVVLMPIIGWMMDLHGWQMPIQILSALSLIAVLWTWFYLPETEKRTVVKREIPIATLLRQRNVQASMGVALLLFTGVGIFMTFWSIWLSADFALSALDLGFVAQQIGVAELLGAILAGLIVDRLGKRRASLIGLIIAALFFLLVPFSRQTLLMVRVLLVLTVFWIEYAIVALFPLYGEQVPEARATVFALIALANGIGLAVGPVITTALWDAYGLAAITAFAAASLLGAFLLLYFFLLDKPEG